MRTIYWPLSGLLAFSSLGAGCFVENEPHGLQQGALSTRIKNQEHFPNSTGKHATYSLRDGKYLDTSNAFFQPLGTNGRACVTCHQPEDGFSVSAANIARRFEETDGTDPIFRPIDGANNPDADVSTLEARRAAYSLLINKGLIRVELEIPPDAEFELVDVDDPNHNSTANGISVFRRPLPSTNLQFIQTIMFDGREPDLVSQARNATLTHAEATASPSEATLQSIVDFELALFTTQVQEKGAGSTSAAGATGDPVALSSAQFFRDMNRDLTKPSAIAVIDPDVFKTFDAWADKDEAKKAIQRGQAIFNRRAFSDNRGGSISCSNCHNATGSGGFTGAMFPLDTRPPFGGFSIQTSSPRFRSPELPLYTLRNKATGALIQSTDPGMALTTGRVADIGRFKTPHLLGLASRAPYFHNGMAATLAEVVDHYDTIFSIGFTPQERSDLIAFLGAL